MHDDDNNPGATPPNHLLDELTSIKDLLGGQDGALPRPEDIPVLDDVVGLGQPPLLDIDHIFEDELPPADAAGELPFEFPRFTLDVAISDAPASGGTDAGLLRERRELLIRQLVDEFLPRIAAELRERLEDLDDAELQALARHD